MMIFMGKRTYHPFLVELLNAGDRTHRCLGTLIASDIVLTAAHCLYDAHVLIRQVYHDVRFNESARLFVVKSTWMHPSYFYNTYTGGVDVDPYDAALIQVHGQAASNFTFSSSSLVRLNRNANLLPANHRGSSSPSSPHLPLVGIGWNQYQNSSTVNTIAEATLLSYVPNNQCILVNGTTGDGSLNVSYASQVIDVTLCTLYQQGPGLCPGDSGGPLLMLSALTGSSSSVPLQVGITSSSYGCRDSRLPSLNVRTSSVSDWVDTVICDSSLYTTPFDYRCSRGPIDSDETQPSMLEIVVQLELGAHPVNLGWILYQTLDEKGQQLLPIVERPLGYYRQQAPHSNTTEILKLPDRSRFELVVFDANFQTSSNGSALSVRLWSSGLPIGDWSFDSTMVTQKVSFDLGAVATPPPSFQTSTNHTNKPNYEVGEAYLTVFIELDSYPTETGFRVEAINGLNDEFDDTASSPRALVFAVYPGTFGPENAQSKVQVNVSLPFSCRHFRFTMTDNEHDGLQPPAYYEAWLGQRNSGTLVARGGAFFLEDPHDFFIPDFYFNSTSIPILSPCPTSQPVVHIGVTSVSSASHPFSVLSQIVAIGWLILAFYRV